MAAAAAAVAVATHSRRQDVTSVTDTISRFLEVIVVAFAVLLGFFSRIFSVVKYESVIHEFDPHFNWRVAKKLVADGFESFFDWFDPFTWYG